MFDKVHLCLTISKHSATNSYAPLLVHPPNENCKSFSRSIYVLSFVVIPELPGNLLRDILGPIFIFMGQYTKISDIYIHPYPFAYTHTMHMLAIGSNTRQVIPFKQSQSCANIWNGLKHPLYHICKGFH